MVAAGLTPVETGRRFRRSERYVEQVLRLARIPRVDVEPRGQMSLRPLERRLLRWRESGADPHDVGAMFGRTPEYIERVLALIDYKQQRAASS